MRELAERLARHALGAPRAVLGFTPQIRHFMQLSDFFIGKPGPGSISEAIQQGLPVIVVRNTWTMPQERYNTDWVKENDAGIVLDSFKLDSRRRCRGSSAGSPEFRRQRSATSAIGGVRDPAHPRKHPSGAGKSSPARSIRRHEGRSDDARRSAAAPSTEGSD